MHYLLSFFIIGFLSTIHAQSYEGQDPNSIDSAALPVEHRGVGDFGPQITGAASDPWPLAQPRDMPAVKNIQVQCEKTFMRVSVEFDRPFYGMIFSKGYYSEPNCVHLQPETGTLQAQFDIYLNSCGMTSSGGNNYGQPTPGGTFIENTVIIQYDPLVQEVWDAARKLRCTWYDYYEKSVTFKPFQVDMLNAVTANFLGDNLQCWMQLQVGKGPWASEVSGIVKIGQTMTMVLAIKDNENKFDMMVRNCVAHDGKRAPIQLVDQNGCITRPKIMGRFQKIKNFGSSASVVSYAYFQAFKFPDSMNVHFQCVIQVCRYQCPEPQCSQYGYSGAYSAAGSQLKEVHVPGAPNTVNDLPDPRQASPHGVAAAQALKSDSLKERNDIGEYTEEEIPFPATFNLHPDTVNLPESSVSRSGPVDTMFGRPRSMDLDKIDTNEFAEIAVSPTKSKRSITKRDTSDVTDVATERVLQVVAPGDLAFTLSTPNETVVITSALTESSHICMSTAGFAAGLIMLLLVLSIACIVAGFLYTRVRSFNAKGSTHPFVQGYDNPEFVKVSPNH